MRTVLATVMLVLLATLAGCGPLFVPMLPRLEPAEQAKVDQMWDNLLTPVQRVDHQTLLDANVRYWMYTVGVDRMRMTSEKHFTGGKAVMEIDCDRANPDADQFTITIFDDRGRTLRRERYSRAEVEESSRMLTYATLTVEVSDPTTQPATGPATEPATRPAETPEERRCRLESERRRVAAAAATQPARLGSPAK